MPKPAIYEDDEIDLDLPPIDDEDDREVSDNEFDVDSLPDDEAEDEDDFVEVKEEEETKASPSDDAEKAALRAEKARLEDELSRKQAADIETAKGMVAAEEQRIKSEETTLKAQLKRAIEDGDPDKQIEINDKLLNLKVRTVQVEDAKRQLENFKPAPPKPRLHVKAQAWADQNKWFNDPIHVEARDYVVTLAARLESQGVGPDKDEYYAKINEAVAKRFPEVRGPKKKAPGNVAPPSRAPASGRGGKEKVTLDPVQVAFARKHGIPLKLVAEEKRKLKRVEV